jgi:hypothetical protein
MGFQLSRKRDSPLKPGKRVGRPQLSILLFLSTLFIYLVLPTADYYWDGIAFAQNIEDAQRLSPDLLHPNHLIYTPFGYLIHTALARIGFELRSLDVLRMINSLLSALSSWVLFYILLALTRSRYLSISLAVIFSFSGYWWKFSTDANAYVPSVFFLLLTFYGLLPHSRVRPFLIALLHVMAMLFHQLAVFFYPAVVVALWQQSSQTPAKGRVLNLVRYSVTAFLATSVIYYGGFLLHSGRAHSLSFWGWMTSYSPEVSFSFNLLRNTLYSLRGHHRLFFRLRIRIFSEIADATALIVAFFVLIGVIFFFYKLVVHRRRLKALLINMFNRKWWAAPPLPAIALWMGSYLTFLFFWLPHNTFYRMFYLPAIILFLAMLLSNQPGKRTHTTAVLASVVFLWNLAFSALPDANPIVNPPLQFAQEMGSEFGDGDTVYYAIFNSDDWTIRYFNPQTVWKHIEVDDLASLEEELESLHLNNKGAWLDTTAVDQIESAGGGSREWLERHSQPGARYQLIKPGYRMRFLKLVP